MKPHYEADGTITVPSDGCYVYGSGLSWWPTTGRHIYAYGQTAIDTYNGDGADRLSTSCPKEVVVPKQLDGVDVSSIGMAAFVGSGITSVHLPDSDIELRGYVFAGVHLSELIVDGSLSGLRPWGGGRLVGTVDRLVFGGNTYSSTDPVDERCCTFDAGSGQIGGSFGIGPTISRLQGGADYACLAHDITIPESIGGVPVTSIRRMGFHGNSLTSVKAPDSVTHIQQGAFEGNFLSNVDLGSGVVTIEDVAFSGNSLEVVNIPLSVESIGYSAFSRQGPLGWALAAEIFDDPDYLGQAYSSTNYTQLLLEDPSNQHQLTQ